MKDKKENTYLPIDEATEILSGEVFRERMSEEEWLKIKAILISKDCLKEENVKEGD